MNILDKYKQQVTAGCVELLYKNIPVRIAEQLTIGAFVVFLLKDITNNALLYGWFSALLFFILMELGLYVYHRHLNPEISQTQKWARVITVLIGVGSLVWACMGLLIPSTTEYPNHFAIMIIFFAAICSGSLIAYGAYLPALYALNLLGIFPYSLFLLIRVVIWEESADLLLLAILMNFYIFIILAYGHTKHKMITESLALRLENIDVVEDLKVQKATAEKANEDKSRFLAAASHDLRQPLHALGLFVDQLRLRSRDKDDAQLTTEIDHSTKALKGLLNGILDISRLDAHVMQPDIKDFYVQPMLERLETEHACLAREKSLALNIKATSLAVRSDPNLLERALRNLISNAIHYTQQGYVNINCLSQDKQVVIEIADSGIGITTEEQEKILQEFYQVGNPERDRSKGLGLGLTIVDRLVRLLEHKLSLSSAPGQGSIFSIELPLGLIPQQEKKPITNQQCNLDGKIVLVIDDEASILKGMREILKQAGCNVMTAESANIACSLLEKEGILPDALIVDYRLRENKTGIEAIEIICKQTETSVPAIIITGDTAPDRLREASAKGYMLLHKPVESETIYAALGKLMQQGT